jgi:hypothetical protein
MNEIMTDKAENVNMIRLNREIRQLMNERDNLIHRFEDK